mgnify:CR=1 FL=1
MTPGERERERERYIVIDRIIPPTEREDTLNAVLDRVSAIVKIMVRMVIIIMMMIMIINVMMMMMMKFNNDGDNDMIMTTI